MGTTSLTNAYAASESASQARTEIMNVGYQIVGTEDQILGRMDQLGAPRLASVTTGRGPVTVSAGMAAAGTVGGLSVPPSWAGGPLLRASVIPLPATTLAAAGDPLAAGPQRLLDRVAMLGTAAAGCRVAAASSGPKPNAASTTVRSMCRPQNTAAGSFTTLASDLYELARLRDCGILTAEEFGQQKRRLLAE
jgi:hypothetical protein